MINIKKPLITRIVGNGFKPFPTLIAIVFIFTGACYSADGPLTLRPALQFSDMGREATEPLSQKNPKQLLTAGRIKYFFDWGSPNGKYFQGDRDVVHEMIRGLLSNPDVVNKVLRRIGSALTYNEVELVGIKYIRHSERTVFKLSFYKSRSEYMFSKQDDSIPTVLVSAKHMLGYNKRQVEAAKKLGDAEVGPKFGEVLEEMYFEEWINGRTALAIGTQRGLRSEELQKIAAKWIQAGRKLSPNDFSGFPSDLNPGNIMSRNGDDLIDLVVFDVFKRKTYHTNPGEFIESLIKYYVQGRGG